MAIVTPAVPPKWRAVADALVSPEAAAALIAATAGGARWFCVRVLALCAALYGVYGFSMGWFHSGMAGVFSAVKLPMLYSATLLVCFPILYILNHRLGPGLRVGQCAAVLSLAMLANAVALASYVPVSYFFVLTSSDQGYRFLVAMHVCVFAAAGLLTVVVAGAIMRAACTLTGRVLQWRFVAMWALAYGLVGTQMSWALRPWVGNLYSDYSFLRPRTGSFIEAVITLFRGLT